jgi:hypothetical protein
MLNISNTTATANTGATATAENSTFLKVRNSFSPKTGEKEKKIPVSFKIDKNINLRIDEATSASHSNIPSEKV